RRRAAVKIFVVLELLADQGGADHLAVLLDQAALRLAREDHAGKCGHRQGVGQAGDRGQQEQKDDSGADFAKHNTSPKFLPSLRGAKRRSNPFWSAVSWIASLRSQWTIKPGARRRPPGRSP